MLRYCLLLFLICETLSQLAMGCSCVGTERPCENLRSDAIFVGRVIEVTSVKHPLAKDSWTTGYSMRFAVDEPLRGDLGTEVNVETGGGGGDCGTPLAPGGRFLLFAYKDKGGKLWTGMCSGNRRLSNEANDEKMLEDYRTLVKKRASIFGQVALVKPIWREDDVEASAPKPAQGLILHAKADGFNAVTKTARDGSYEFSELPDGKYTVLPEIASGLDFDHEYEDRYQADLRGGECAHISFTLEPSTRIRGRVTLPAGMEARTLKVVAIPIHMKELNQFSGQSDFTGEDGRFDLWPLPPGDYYVGINIGSSPQAESPFPPTYYPGVTSEKAANVVRVEEGEVKELELVLQEVAKPRTVHFVAIGLDGKPLRKIYIQLEDLRHPGDAASYVNVDLDASGIGTMTIFSGYSYHLHGSHWVSYMNDWCSKPVVIPAGTSRVEARFVMDRKSGNCDIYEIDGLKR